MVIIDLSSSDESDNEEALSWSHALKAQPHPKYEAYLDAVADAKWKASEETLHHRGMTDGEYTLPMLIRELRRAYEAFIEIDDPRLQRVVYVRDVEDEHDSLIMQLEMMIEMQTNIGVPRPRWAQRQTKLRHKGEAYLMESFLRMLAEFGDPAPYSFAQALAQHVHAHHA